MLEGADAGLRVWVGAVASGVRVIVRFRVTTLGIGVVILAPELSLSTSRLSLVVGGHSRFRRSILTVQSQGDRSGSGLSLRL